MSKDATKIQPKTLTNISEQPMVPNIPGKPMEELIKKIRTLHGELKEALLLSPGITDQDRTKMDSVIRTYDELIDENLGASPGEDFKKNEEVEPMEHQLSPEAGLRDVTLAL